MPQKGGPEWQKSITKDLGQISPLKGKGHGPGRKMLLMARQELTSPQRFQRVRYDF